MEDKPVMAQVLVGCLHLFEFRGHLDDGADGYLQSFRGVNDVAGYIVQEGKVWLSSKAGISALRENVQVNSCTCLRR